MNAELFIETLQRFIKYTNSSKQNPSLLIMDNHESYISIDSINLAKENGITILTLPLHCSNRLQPLDVTVYGPFKSFYNAAVDSWLQRYPGKPIDNYHVAEYVNVAFVKSMIPSNIMNGFKVTGLFPFDQNIFNDDDFTVSAVTDRQNESERFNIGNDNTASNQESSTTSEQLTDQMNPTKKVLVETENQTTNAEMISPENIRPYPRAEPRKENSNRKRKKTSAILTNTPKKQKIEEAAVQRANKIKNKLYPPVIENKTKSTANNKKKKNKNTEKYK